MKLPITPFLDSFRVGDYSGVDNSRAVNQSELQEIYPAFPVKGGIRQHSRMGTVNGIGGTVFIGTGANAAVPLDTAGRISSTVTTARRIQLALKFLW